MTELVEIEYASPLEDADPDDDNIDVHVRLSDGRIYSFLIATPKNIYRCMANEGIDYYFGTPPLFVSSLTRECVERAIRALLSEDNGRWLDLYGALQS